MIAWNIVIIRFIIQAMVLRSINAVKSSMTNCFLNVGQIPKSRKRRFIWTCRGFIKIFATSKLCWSLLTADIFQVWNIKCFFFFQIKYVSGSYDSEDGFLLLNKEISEHEIAKNSQPGSSRRLFYLALPPSVYPSVCKMIRKYCMNQCKCFSFFQFHIMDNYPSSS